MVRGQKCKGICCCGCRLNKYWNYGFRGDSEAVGTIFEKAGELTEIEIMRVKQTLDQITPAYLGWAKWIFKLFYRDG